jgi:hypothetical protein
VLSYFADGAAADPGVPARCDLSGGGGGVMLSVVI